MYNILACIYIIYNIFIPYNEDKEAYELFHSNGSDSLLPSKSLL